MVIGWTKHIMEEVAVMTSFEHSIFCLSVTWGRPTRQICNVLQRAGLFVLCLEQYRSSKERVLFD